MDRERRERLGEVARVHLPSRQQPQQQEAGVGGVVTLNQPRPDVQRTANEYVETPLRATAKPGAGGRASSTTTPTSGTVTTVPHAHAQHHGHTTHHHHHHHHHHRTTATSQTTAGGGGVVVKQPHKESRDGGGGPSASDCSIICRECGKCRCEACRQPRPVPSMWLCDNFCLCSMESCVDYGSCLCCVKAAMYHCGSGSGDDDDTCSADDPCSCTPHGRVPRWACLAVATLVLPCLCCYWPLRSCAKLSESCYASCSQRGCSCHSHPAANSQPPEKRLLRSSPEF